MNVVYQPRAGDPDITLAFGQAFVAGKGVPLSDITAGKSEDEAKRIEQKLRGNPMFKVGNQDPAKDATPKADERLGKEIDGRSKEARKLREKADAANAEAKAAARGLEQAEAIRAAQNGAPEDQG